MAHAKTPTEQHLWYRSQGHARPFIDRDLQLQIPGTEQKQDSACMKKIYAHYANSLPPVVSSSLLETSGLKTALQEAAASHAAWRELKQSLDPNLSS